MNKKMDLLKWVFHIIVFFVAFIFILGEFILPKEIKNDTHFELFEAPWKMIRQDGTTMDIRIPGIYPAERNEIVTVETVLPEDIKENLFLCFRSNRQDMELYVDNELRQSYSTEKSRLFGHSSPGAFVFLKIKEGDGGKTLRVTYQTDTAYSGNLQEIFYGDIMGIWSYQFKERGEELIVAILLLILGIISILGSWGLHFCYHKPLELEYLGWGVTFAAFWMIADSVFRQLLFPNISAVNDMAFVMVMLLPFPFLIYMNEVQKRRYNVLYVVISALVALDIVVCITLQFLNLVDFSDSIAVFAGFCGISIILIIVTCIMDCIKGYIAQYKLVAIGVLGAAVACVIQLVLYFQRIANSSGVMIALGMIFLLVISCINTIRDIFHMENEKKQAIYANEAKAQFLANMSHEIRTPINAVLGMDEMILQESKEPNVLEYATDIHNAGKTLLSLINDILDFSKIESGKMEILPVNYDLSHLISDSYNMVAKRAEEKGLEFILENDTTLPCKLHGDEVRLRQVLVNLLTNAVKYTKEGSIRMSVQGKRLEDNQLLLQISVQDTGIGITKENCEKLFDSFQRVDEKRNRNIEGTGLGLSITKQIVSLMQGSISVDSEYGKGSVFKVEIPQHIVDDSPVGNFSLKMDAIIHEIPQTKETLIAPEGRILVVDDVDMNLKVFFGLLKQTQIQIDMVSSGYEALEMVRTKKYHIIFLDHMMPQMDGLETFKAMKQLKDNQNTETPVIMLTANAIVGIREKYIQEGFSDYLSKPVQRKQLYNIIRKHLPKEYILDSEEVPLLAKEKSVEKVEVIEEVEAIEKEENHNVTTSPDLFTVFDFLDTKTGLMYCGDSEDFYLEILKTSLDNDRTSLILEAYEQQDWQQYGICMHSLKSTSLSIGANKLSERAKALEMAVKEERLDYVQQEHDSFLKEYQELLQKIEKGLVSLQAGNMHHRP